jgi:hypothetical protein
MKFNEDIHTASYLIENPHIAIELAKHSADFAASSLANDRSVLKLSVSWDTVAHKLAQFQPSWLSMDASRDLSVLKQKNKKNGVTVAHTLALYQSAWVSSEAASNPEVLRLKCSHNETVAHHLACNQPLWVHTIQAKNKDILQLKDHFGWTVAHYFARSNPEWLFTESARDIEILKFSTEEMISVANVLIAYQDCFEHEPLHTKEILTLICKDGEMFAERFLDKFRETHDIDTRKMAVKLISLGAAYKQKRMIKQSDLISIENDVKQLVDDCVDPKVSIRYAQALYATQYHNLMNLKQWPKPNQNQLNVLTQFLKNSEFLIVGILERNPHLAEESTSGDFFCEPAVEFMDRLKAEVLLKKIELPQVMVDDYQFQNMNY